MDKKGGLVLSVIILVVIFGVGFLIGSQGSIAQLAPNPLNIGDSDGLFINANACSADDTCETNDIRAKGDLWVINPAGTARAFIDRVLATQVNTGSLNVNEAEEPEGVYINPQNIRADFLEGFGNAFVCVDSQGILYRSEFPCSFSGLTEFDGCFQLTVDVKDMVKRLQNDIDPEDPVVLKEMERVYRSQHLVLPGDNNGSIVEVRTISNSTAGYSNDVVEFEDDINGEIYIAVITSEGVGTVTIGGVQYDLTYHGSSFIPPEQRYVILDFPHSEGGAIMTFYCDDF